MMRKIILIIVFLFILTTQAFGAEFVLMGNNGKSKTCQILDNGYLCPGEKKVDVKNFKFLFFMPKEAVYKTITAYGGKNINYLQLNNGRRYENGDLVLDSPFIKKKKGIIVKNLQGVEDICELKKNGGYICNTKQQLFNPLLPENKSWSFYRSDLDLQDNKPCIGFPNGFQTDEKVYFVENFQDKFFPYVYFDNPDAFRYENNKKGYVLFADGLYIPGELPVVYENRIVYEMPEPTFTAPVTNIEVKSLTKEDLKYYKPPSVKTKVIYGTNGNGKSYTIIEKYGRTYIHPGPYGTGGDI